MNKYEINDCRKMKEFKGITFSKYKKSAAKKELINAVINQKLEESCYWSGEFICAGHFIELWEIIFLLCSKHIHRGNPKLPIYLDMRLDYFKDILNNGYIDNEIKLRNNIKIRELFSEIMSILCFSRKKNSLDIPKITSDEYNVINISHRLTADNVNYGNKVFKKEDPQELFLAINELSWNLKKKNSNIGNCIYWIEWILGFETLSKREKKKTYSCERRNVPVQSNNQTDIVWMIWDVIQYEALNRGKGIMKIIDSLLNLFCLKYSPGIKKRRKFLIYHSIILLCEPINNSINIINNKSIIEKIKKKINLVYLQIKKNEIKPKTDYLFNNSFNSGNLEKTLKKLDKFSEINNLIPRNK